MAEQLSNAAQAAKDAIADITESVGNATIAPASTTTEAGSAKLFKDEETGEMVSKSECMQ